MKLFNRPIYAIFVFLLISGLASGCSSDPEERKISHYEKGMEYVNAGELHSAIIEFRNAVQIDPRFADARYQLGLAYLHTDQANNAVGELERAGSIDPENTDALIKAAEIYALGNRPRQSREIIDRIFEVDEDFPDAHALLAQIEMRENNVSKAENAIKLALAADSDESRYHIIHSRVLSEAGRIKEAKESMNTAMTLDPSVDNLRMLIRFHTRFDNTDEAEQYLLSLMEQEADAHLLHMDMATFYISRNQADEAEKYILKAVKNNPDNPELLTYLGNFYLQAQSPDKAEQAFKDAVDVSENPADANAVLANFYFNTQRFDLAADKVVATLQSNPNHAIGNLVKAKLLVREQKGSEALDILDDLIQDFPRWGEAYYQKGLAHLNRGETRLSLNATNRALEYSPGNPDAETLLAHHQMLQGDYKKARSTAISALQKMPGNLRAGIVLGRSFLFLGETGKAVRLFEDMIEAAPENREIRFNLAGAYIANNQRGEGRATLETILEYYPNFAPALAAMTELLIEQGKTGEAIEYVRAQLRRSPENPRYLIMLADLINRGTENYEESLALLEKARGIAPNIPEVYSLTADIMMRQGKTEQAIDSYRDMVKATPDAIEGHMALGSLLEQSGDKEGAMAAFEKALDIRPGFAPAANNLAWLMANSDEPDLGEALRLAMIAKEAYPEDPLIADTLGYVHYKRGSYRLALTQFTEAVDRRPDMPVLRYHLAKALHAGGQTDKARKELERALDQNGEFPNREEAKRMLAEMER